MEAPTLLHVANNDSGANAEDSDIKVINRMAPNGTIKRRGRPPKIKAENGLDCSPMKQTKVTDSMKKIKRTVDRFNGITKEELMQRLLPDRIKPGLDILIIGINPGLVAAYKGHHYAGPGNHFWKCLYRSGLIPEPLTGMQDYLALNYDIGLTNIVQRTTAGSKDLSRYHIESHKSNLLVTSFPAGKCVNQSGLVDKPVTCENDMELLDYGIGFSTVVQRTTPAAKDLTSKEIRDGGVELIEKIQRYQPRIVVFNGKGIYEVFSKTVFGQKKKDFSFGTQPNRIPGTDTRIFVMPSTSARCAQFPRAEDKVHFFIQVKRLRDQLRGVPFNDDVVETNYTFDLGKATEMAKVQSVKEECHDSSYDAKQQPFPQKPQENHYDQYVTEVGREETPGCSKNAPTSFPPKPALKKVRAPRRANCSKDRDDKTSKDVIDHPHLVQFLCDDESLSKAVQPVPLTSGTYNTLRPSMPQMRETVSDDQKNQRVGLWVRTQVDQHYDSEPPMGFDDRQRTETASQPGSDHSSQRSMASAGVSGSTSTGSTSGYGSIDTNIHHAQRDRVEMWVREQQYVRQHALPNQPGDARPIRNQPAPPPDLDEQQPTSSSSFDVVGYSPHLLVATSESGSAADVTLRPPVPLFSSWGGETDGPAVVVDACNVYK